MKSYLLLIFVVFLSVLPAKRATGGEAGSGQKFYLKYCSSCHGKEGKGNGPMAPHLKAKVPDLTLLRQKHKGIYPLDYVMSTIDGRRAVGAHGDREMPVWGEVFRKEIAKDKYQELTTLLTAEAIAGYVETLQR
jgi:mono/diheme cytochrome c family protein